MGRIPLDTGIVRLLAVGLVAAAVSGCSNPVEQRGNLPPDKVVAEIKPGSTDKETVTRLLGSPSSVASFDDSTWYYISQKTKEIAFFKPETIDQEVVTITFDKDGVVKGVQKLGMNARNELTPVERTTPAPGKELTFFEQLIGNFGRFNNTNTSPGYNSPQQQ
jgi:outer membrane protein assembly factor BamE (lipoprotein component of BamABCDE complex)